MKGISGCRLPWVEQVNQGFGAPVPASPALWGIAIGASNRLVRAGIQKELNGFPGSVCRRAMHWRLPTRTDVRTLTSARGDRAPVRVGAMLDEQFDHLVPV